jgi:hypothetical protein
MQQPRQLYGLGSFVKKITKPIKKVVKSPIGKAALTGAAIYFGGGGGNPFTAAGRSQFGSNVFGKFLKDSILGGFQPIKGGASSIREGGLLGLLRKAKTGFGNLSFGQQALLGLGAAGVAAPFFFGKEDEEEVVEDPFSVTPSSISDIVAQARRRDPSLRFLPPTASAQPGFFTAAEGGTPREMFAKGSSKGGGIFSLANLIKLLNPLDPSKSTLRKTLETGSYVLPMLPFKDGGTPREMFAGGASKNRVAQLLQLLEGIEDPMDRKMIQDEIDMLLGKFAKGGIADLPKVRMLEGGMPEIDYRQSGGFVPVGKKEKADDVPAMLSKNEFVMTADAVRGMGDGSVEKGAQRMYDQMKQLENRVV